MTVTEFLKEIAAIAVGILLADIIKHWWKRFRYIFQRL